MWLDTDLVGNVQQDRLWRCTFAVWLPVVVSQTCTLLLSVFVIFSCQNDGSKALLVHYYFVLTTSDVTDHWKLSVDVIVNLLEMVTLVSCDTQHFSICFLLWSHVTNVTVYLHTTTDKFCSQPQYFKTAVYHQLLTDLWFRLLLIYLFSFLWKTVTYASCDTSSEHGKDRSWELQHDSCKS